MNKLNKIFLGIIIALAIALVIMTVLYFNMKSVAKKNLNEYLNKCEETSKLYERIDLLENGSNINGDFLFSEEGN